jgi:hypothetical protein
MSCIRIHSKTRTLISALLLSSAAVAQTIPATGLCNTGLTPANALPLGCTTSTLVTPVNPQSGGTSVDGNWQLATGYALPFGILHSPSAKSVCAHSIRPRLG